MPRRPIGASMIDTRGKRIAFRVVVAREGASVPLAFDLRSNSLQTPANTQKVARVGITPLPAPERS
jgi:hypothetical protein